MEERRFRIHPQMLYQVIVAQAGTPAKALLESVMNSIDAGASRVDITLSKSGYTVKDDGKGFAGEQEVVDFFETFGTPHQEGDTRWGKFRMGRGQGFAFATNRWRTATFEMFVDIKNKGLSYDFRKDLPFVPGCEIVGQWYQQPDDRYLNHWHESLREFCAWCHVPVWINGTKVSKNPADETWTLETPEAWIKLTGNSVLQVYNLGVLVRDYSRSFVGVGGIVVSKQGLAMNMARNDILLSQCQIWPKIVKDLKSLATDNILKGKRQDEDTRRYLVSLVKSKEHSLAEIRNWKIFSDTQGRHLSLVQLAKNSLPIVFLPKDDRMGDILATRKLALVLTNETLDRLNLASPEDFKQWLVDQVSPSDDYSLRQNLASQTFMSAQEAETLLGNRSYLSVADNELTKQELAALRTLRNARLHSHLVYLMRRNTECSPRQLRAGSSEEALAWTDGSNFIWIDRKMLKEVGQGGLNGVVRVLAILVHEYLHNENDTGSHYHDFEFYEAFEHIWINQGLGDLAGFTLNQYLKEAEKLNVPVSKRVVAAAYPDQSV